MLNNKDTLNTVNVKTLNINHHSNLSCLKFPVFSKPMIVYHGATETEQDCLPNVFTNKKLPGGRKKKVANQA